MRSLPILALLAAAACSTGKPLPACHGETAPANPAGFAPVVWDDGARTFFRFPGNQRMPAIYALHPDGREAAVNTTVVEDTVAVHQTAAEWVLRDGDRVACVRNAAWDPVGRTTGTMTASPAVERVPRAARAGGAGR